jgi:hypothetical protein
MFTRTNVRPRRPGRLLGALATIVVLGVTACATDPVEPVDESTAQLAPAEGAKKDPGPPDDGTSEKCGVPFAAAQQACGDKTDPDPAAHAALVACLTAAEAAWRTCMGLPAAP